MKHRTSICATLTKILGKETPEQDEDELRRILELMRLSFSLGLSLFK